jgi:hypothetical protein
MPAGYRWSFTVGASQAAPDDFSLFLPLVSG